MGEMMSFLRRGNMLEWNYCSKMRKKANPPSFLVMKDGLFWERSRGHNAFLARE